MNVTLIIGIILLIFGIKIGFKTGMAKGIANILALIATLITLALILMLTESFKAGETGNTLFTLLLLAILGTVYSVVRFMLRSMKAISKLPIISFINRIIGAFLGVIWVTLLFMAFLTLGIRGYLGEFSSVIARDVSSNLFLTILCKYNIFL